MNNLIIKRSQLIEAQFTGAPATGKKYQFTEIPNISRNNIVVYGIEAFTSTQLSTTPNNNTVVSSGVQDQLVVTLIDNDNKERVYQLPYYTAIRSLNGGFVLMVKPFILNLTRSYVQITDATGISANQVASFNLYYSIVGED
ncbi:MAG: hypothetical protein EBQ97_00220 [Bacteroidetes bacterium]|nr:hypothetical protein [Bacteroidota bacterium]